METEWTKETSLFQGTGEKLVWRDKNGLRSLPTIFKTRFPPTESLEQATKRNTLSWKLKANNNAINRSQNKNQSQVGRMRPLIKSGRKSYHNIGTFPASRGLSRRGKNERKERDLCRLPTRCLMKPPTKFLVESYRFLKPVTFNV